MSDTIITVGDRHIREVHREIQQAANAGEVANAIQSVSAVTEQSAAGSEEMASSSEELGAQATGMSELVAKFKINKD